MPEIIQIPIDCLNLCVCDLYFCNALRERFNTLRANSFKRANQLFISAFEKGDNNSH